MLRHTRSHHALLTVFLGAAVVLRAQTAAPPLQTLVTVTDHAPALDFTTSNLEVKVDGRVVPITSVVKGFDLPVRIGIVFDESGSSRHVKYFTEFLQRSLDFTADILKQPGSDAFLVGFNDQVIISTAVVTDAGDLRAAAGQLRPIGGSAVRDALLHAAQKFYSLGPEPRPAARILLLVSDGHDNSSYASEQRAIESMQGFGIRAYVIGLPSAEAAAGQHLLENISGQTGGRAFYPHDDRELAAALAAIRQDMANSFFVTLIPQSHDGKFHKLNIRAHSIPNLSLRYMTGFPAWKLGCYGPC
jgi:VWFA-related protein